MNRAREAEEEIEQQNAREEAERQKKVDIRKSYAAQFSEVLLSSATYPYCAHASSDTFSRRASPVVVPNHSGSFLSNDCQWCILLHYFLST